MTEKPISLSNYQKAKQEAELQKSYEKRKTLVRATLTSYKKLYHLILRQTGKENYAGESHDNPIGESFFYELLSPGDQLDLRNIELVLGRIIRKVEGRLEK